MIHTPDKLPFSFSLVPALKRYANKQTHKIQQGFEGHGQEDRSSSRKALLRRSVNRFLLWAPILTPQLKGEQVNSGSQFLCMFSWLQAATGWDRGKVEGKVCNLWQPKKQRKRRRSPGQEHILHAMPPVAPPGPTSTPQQQ